MNVARVIEIDGKPMVIIFAKKVGTHQHHDIVGITNFETGEATCRHYPWETMPGSEAQTTAWLAHKVQLIIGCPVEARPRKLGEDFVLEIVNVFRPGSKENPQPATTAA